MKKKVEEKEKSKI